MHIFNEFEWEKENQNDNKGNKDNVCNVWLVSFNRVKRKRERERMRRGNEQKLKTAWCAVGLGCISTSTRHRYQKIKSLLKAIAWHNESSHFIFRLFYPLFVFLLTNQKQESFQLFFTLRSYIIKLKYKIIYLRMATIHRDNRKGYRNESQTHRERKK